MKTIEFLDWLKDWITRHPLQTPPESLRASYTEAVMRRVRAPQALTPAWRWGWQPQLAMSWGTALACLLAVVVVMKRAPTQLASEVEHDWQLLTEVGEEHDLSSSNLDDEVQMVDRLVLAEASPSEEDETWIRQTLELLNDVDEQADATPEDQDNPDGWLKDLEQLDEAELASS